MEGVIGSPLSSQVPQLDSTLFRNPLETPAAEFGTRMLSEVMQADLYVNWMPNLAIFIRC